MLFCALALAPAAASAQGRTDPVGTPITEADASCRVIPDTVRGPTAGQVTERRQLRDTLAAVARKHGVDGARGILFVDVDSARKGKVLFLESNLSEPAVAEATRLRSEHLSTLPAGRPYQALVRIDGDYPALAPGRRHCLPALANRDELTEMMQAVLENHPQSGKQTPASRRAILRLVVNRDGGVSYVDVDQPTGDAFIDSYVSSIAMKLRFRPASLDGEPYDVRYRFTMIFNVR